MRAIFVLSLLIGLCLSLTAASAQPRRIIILRHGEKMEDPGGLCSTGVLRSKALAEIYLGRGAQKSLYDGDQPAAFYAITAHTIETIKPSAESWGLEPLLPSTDPGQFSDKDLLEDQQTRDAAKDVLTNPKFNNKLVVMTWEHKRIANKRFDADTPADPKTLRRLLNIDQYAADRPSPKIPETWSGENYDFFWIVDYADPSSPKPTKVAIVPQIFPPPYDTLPANEWKTPEPALAGCKQKDTARPDPR